MARQRHPQSIHHKHPRPTSRRIHTVRLHRSHAPRQRPLSLRQEVTPRRQSTRTRRATHYHRQHLHQLARLLEPNLPSRRLAHRTHHPTQPTRRHLRTRRNRQITIRALHSSRTRHWTQHLRTRQPTNQHPLHGLRNATSPTPRTTNSNGIQQRHRPDPPLLRI
ncbi:MAG: hypothetical protein EBR82_80300, partial [Caulobacteraceae bacterium]|nr:hypothetical protein [Caulobacteraceae bacterium]